MSKERWGYACLLTKGYLPEEERIEVLWEAIDMFYDREDRKKVRGETYEGEISTDGSRGVLGAFSGQLFDVELDSDYGKYYMKVLIDPRDRSAASLYKYSKN